MAGWGTYKNWEWRKDSDNIGWLLINREGSSMNTFSEPVIRELADIVEQLEQDSSLKGIIVASAKPSGFIAGADIEQFTRFRDEADAYHLVEQVQELFNRFERLPMPTVAMIEGVCLGGGTEFALTCRYRVAEDSSKTRIGLPEVKLGVHPGWGGTVRLPRLIGAPQAMSLILSGSTVNAKTAEKLGIIDVAVPKRELERAAFFYITGQPTPHRPTYLQALTNHKIMRSLLGKRFTKELLKKISPGHYPAPYAVVNNWERFGIEIPQAMQQEAKSIAHLFMQASSKNLVRDFFLQERLKSLAKGIVFNPQHIHVVGAGTMGGDIAAWCALKGFRVTLQDRAPKYIAPAIKRAYTLFQKKLKIPREIQAAMDRLLPDPQGIGIRKADVIIEAIFENLEAKQQLFKIIEAQAKPEALLATNTSSIPLDEINQALQNTHRLLGLHFFNPVAKMPLVEVVSGQATNAEVAHKALAFVRKLDHLPLPVASRPGFLVNRILMPYLSESTILLEEGIPAATIDQAALQFGMPMGPVELADTVGLDICLSVAENLTAHFGGKVPELLVEMVKKGELGRKTGKGFYVYKNGKAIKPIEKVSHEKTSQEMPLSDITDRLILRMLNESVACLREGIVKDADLLDAGMVFGAGFAPFRGGPMQYARTQSITAIVARLTELTAQYGPRFQPDSGWIELQLV
ncbi:MAG: 3-hydroxyacyl-CoA dehydrogenase NAD-binding domain-containing protein [Gammaproteobacteria bacterium]